MHSQKHDIVHRYVQIVKIQVAVLFVFAKLNWQYQTTDYIFSVKNTCYEKFVEKCDFLIIFVNVFESLRFFCSAGCHF